MKYASQYTALRCSVNKSGENRGSQITYLFGGLLEPKKGHVVIHRKTLTVQAHLAQVHHRRSVMLLRALHVVLEGNTGQRRVAELAAGKGLLSGCKQYVAHTSAP